MSRQRVALVILLLVFAAAVVWSYRSMPRLKTAEVSSQSRPAVRTAELPKQHAGTAAKENQEPGRFLRLELLETPPHGFKGYRRNLFQPLFIDEVRVMKQKAVAVKPLAAPKLPIEVKLAEPPKPAQPEAAQRELARFTFLGFLKRGEQKTIFLSKDKEILLVRAGEKFGGRYEATSITDQALTILVPDSGEEIVIPLVESKPLTAAK